MSWNLAHDVHDPWIEGLFANVLLDIAYVDGDVCEHLLLR
jgi:hypothetical protein